MLRIGMSDTDIKKFSIVNIIRAAMDHRVAGFEREVSDTVVRDSKIAPRGYFVPWDVLLHRGLSIGMADHSGENLVATDMKSFVDVLTNKMLVQKLGATVLPGLVGDVAIPALSVETSSYWVNEGIAPAEGLPVMGQIE